MATTQNTKTEYYEPILDLELEKQLQKELYETRLPEESTNLINGDNSKTNLTSGMMVIGASVIGLVGMQIPFLFIKHAPFMATPARKVQKALKYIERNSNVTPSIASTTPRRLSLLSSQQKPHNFVDLGSGDGQAVYEAAKLGYQAVGIEFNWTLWAFSSLRRKLFWPPEVQRRSKFLLKDFSHYNLQHANTIMIFAVPRTMPVLGRKIQSECTPGTNIMAYRFEMPLATSSTTTQTKYGESNQDSTTRTFNSRSSSGEVKDDATDTSLRATCIYNQEEMRIYRMGE